MNCVQPCARMSRSISYFTYHPISAIPWETTYSKSQHAQKQWFLLCSHCDRRSQWEPYKNNGFLTSRQGIGVPNAGWLKPPAERHRGNAIFGSYQLWIEFWACAGSWAESLGCPGSPWNMRKMLLAIVQKIAEIGWCVVMIIRWYERMSWKRIENTIVPPQACERDLISVTFLDRKP